MAENSSQLSARLHTLWREPDYYSFFEKYAKRPARKYKKGSALFYEGDIPNKIYFIRKGYVKLFRISEAGRDAAIYLYGPGSILGVRAIVSKEGVFRYSTETLTDCEINTVSREEYLKILSENPEYIIDLMHMFIQRLNNAERKLEGFILTDAAARIASFLADCAKRFGEKKGKDIVIPLPLTHQKIADFIGAFRETATIAINKLEHENIITIKGGVVTIHNLKKLEKKTQIQDLLPKE
ncbi:MAG: Crp/Fnr family transcriptional regulator [Candidatus Levybacteria bacterium]|nr:Crp/Fnr family transcriptional regulator [Candidatus Levybacteria bacterium]